MSFQSWVETLMTSALGSASNTGFTTAKSVLDSGQVVNLPANWWYSGRAVRITATGGLVLRANTADTFTLSIQSGTYVYLSSGAIPFTKDALGPLPFWLDVLLTCRTAGVATAGTPTATFMGLMRLNSAVINLAANTAISTSTHNTMLLPLTNPAATNVTATNIAQTIDLYCAESYGTTNGIRVDQFVVEALN